MVKILSHHLRYLSLVFFFVELKTWRIGIVDDRADQKGNPAQMSGFIFGFLCIYKYNVAIKKVKKIELKKSSIMSLG